MTVDADKVETILRQKWQIPGDLSPAVFHNLAFRIQVMVGQKYSHDNLKYQLSLIQTKDLQQNFDDPACDQIASALLGTSLA
jgi:GTP-dependent phosphoenolpyruvate carboxykinase